MYYKCIIIIKLLLVLNIGIYAQLTKIKGVQMVSLGFGFTKYSTVTNIGYNYFLSKDMCIGDELNFEFGKVKLSNYFDFDNNEVFKYNLYSFQFNKVLHYQLNENLKSYYSINLIQTAGFGYEYIYNDKKNSHLNGMRYNIGFGFSNNLTIKNYEIGLRMEEKYMINSLLGKFYWVVMPEVKYLF